MCLVIKSAIRQSFKILSIGKYSKGKRTANYINTSFKCKLFEIDYF